MSDRCEMDHVGGGVCYGIIVDSHCLREEEHAPLPITPEQQVLVDAVMAHAVEHYEQGGWDVIVECWDAAMIRDRLVRYHPDVTLPDGAVAAFVVVASIWRDRQDDARNSAF